MSQKEDEPQRVREKIGDALGVVARRVQGDLERFKDFVQREGTAIEGWRGTILAKDDAAQR